MALQRPSPRREFPAFPFDPYPIQTDFMSFLYDSLDKGGIAMLESPTGTGKTLSIICSALQWLVDRRKQRHPLEGAESNAVSADDEPDWLRGFTVAPPPKKEPARRSKLVPGLGALERNPLNVIPKNLQRPLKEVGDDEEAEFLLEDYESEEEIGRSKRKGNRCSGWSSSEEDEDVNNDDDGEEVKPKIYFASRTHSQLSQFVKEFKLTTFASERSLVCLGSRKNLCINSEVLGIQNSSGINERCLELQKNRKDSKVKVLSNGGRTRRTKSSSGCPMIRKQSLKRAFMSEAREHGALDIEDLVQLGSRIGTCPYYASRDMVRAADLVVLPYQSLLLKSARESLGLNLENNVLIIDEAHNLADSLTSMYNAKITVSQLKQVLHILGLYFDRFRNRLGPGNRRYIQTLIVLAQSFLRLLLGSLDDNTYAFTSSRTGEESEERVFGDTSMTINEFLFSLDIDNINLVKLHQYVKESNIIDKVSGYGSRTINLQNSSVPVDSQTGGTDGSIVSGFRALVDILLSLINNDSDGRMIFSRQQPPCTTQIEGYLKFVMLSGEKIFSEIIGEAHAVVLAGGTLQPIEETRMRLFPNVMSDQVHFFTCNHIIAPESILPIIVPCGPSSRTFDFSYNSRSSPSMIEELGRLLCNLVAVVPEGIVAFFSSFEYEQRVYDAWKASGILQRILKKKCVFREPRYSTEVEDTLMEYRKAITCSHGISEDEGPHGALLLAVVGGKISEGINFSDGMGRCVIMIGLPYPSPSDVELMERIKHLDRLGESSSLEQNKPAITSICNNGVQFGFDILRSCKQKGREYYENLCMKSVNQSIGRAIRHINDYAAVLLVDSRYAHNASNKNSHPANKLPLWIKDRLVSDTKSYGQIHRMLHNFFQFNKQKALNCPDMNG